MEKVKQNSQNNNYYAVGQMYCFDFGTQNIQSNRQFQQTLDK